MSSSFFLQSCHRESVAVPLPPANLQSVAAGQRLRPDGFTVPFSRFAQHRCVLHCCKHVHTACWGQRGCPLSVLGTARMHRRLPGRPNRRQPVHCTHWPAPLPSAGASCRCWKGWRQPTAWRAHCPLAARPARGAAMRPASWAALPPWRRCRVGGRLGAGGPGMQCASPFASANGAPIRQPTRQPQCPVCPLFSQGPCCLASIQHTPHLCPLPLLRRPSGGMLLHAGRRPRQRRRGACAQPHPAARRARVHRDHARPHHGCGEEPGTGGSGQATLRESTQAAPTHTAVPLRIRKMNPPAARSSVHFVPLPAADKSRAYAICPPSLVATEVTQLRSNHPDFKLGERRRAAAAWPAFPPCMALTVQGWPPCSAPAADQLRLTA